MELFSRPTVSTYEDTSRQSPFGVFCISRFITICFRIGGYIAPTLTPHVVCAACFPISPHFYLPAQQHQCRHLKIIARHSLCMICRRRLFWAQLMRSSSSSLLHPAVSLCVHLPFLWAYLRPSCLDDCAYLGRRFHTSPVLC